MKFAVFALLLLAFLPLADSSHIEVKITKSQSQFLEELRGNIIWKVGGEEYCKDDGEAIVPAKTMWKTFICEDGKLPASGTAEITFVPEGSDSGQTYRYFYQETCEEAGGKCRMSCYDGEKPASNAGCLFTCCISEEKEEEGNGACEVTLGENCVNIKDCVCPETYFCWLDGPYSEWSWEEMEDEIEGSGLATEGYNERIKQGCLPDSLEGVYGSGESGIQSDSECSDCGSGWFGLDKCDEEECHSLGDCVFDDGECLSCNDIEYCEDYIEDECEENRCGLGTGCVYSDGKCFFDEEKYCENIGYCEDYSADFCEVNICGIDDECSLSGNYCISKFSIDIELESQNGNIVRLFLFNSYTIHSSGRRCEKCEIDWGEGRYPKQISPEKLDSRYVYTETGDYEIKYSCLCDDVLIEDSISVSISENRPSDLCKPLVMKEQVLDKSLDIVFIGHNYVDIDNLEDESMSSYRTLTATYPISAAKGKINIWLIEEDDLDLGCQISGNSGMRCDYSSIYSYASGCPYDEIIVLVDSERKANLEFERRGSAIIYGHITMSDGTSNEIILHEFGHSFGGLWDEYISKGNFNAADYNYEIPESPNCDLNPMCIKWRDEVGALSCYSGCTFEEFYRSSEECVMKNVHLLDRFCEVCSNHLKELLSNYGD